MIVNKLGKWKLKMKGKGKFTKPEEVKEVEGLFGERDLRVQNIRSTDKERRQDRCRCLESLFG